MSALTELQQLLLTAAFDRGETALVAWRRWEREYHWEERVDFDCYLLLPRVYDNLGTNMPDDALFRRIKGIIRQNWVANAKRIAALKAVSRCVDPSGGPLIVLPPLSLACLHRGTALGRESTALWLPRRRDLSPLSRKLRQQGWSTPHRHIPGWCMEGYAAATASLTWAHEVHGEMQLHWLANTGATRWQTGDSSVQLPLGQPPLHALAPADTVRFLLLAPRLGPAFRRCLRALLYLQSAVDRDAWRYFLQHLATTGSPLLATARSIAPVDSPAETLPPLATRPASLSEIPTGSRRLPFFNKQRQHWQRLRQDVGEDRGTWRVLRAVPGYLLGKWQLSTPAQIPGRLLRGLLSDYRRRARKREQP